MDKDSWVMKKLFPEGDNSRKLRTNVKKIDISQSVNRKTKITLCVLGSWAVYMPPYNLARLSSLLRVSGYKTKVYDFNVDAYKELPEKNSALKSAWDSANFHWWLSKKEYDIRIKDTYEPLLSEQLETLLADDPDIIGFSCYYTNKWSTFWMMSEIKSRRPDITIIAGGPECAESKYTAPSEVSFYFVGESEQNILDFLENYENGILPAEKKIGGLYSDTRIDIDSLPYPDYSDFDFDKYITNTSICSEISRGCVAKCTYCSEVRYWKFRDRGSKNVIDEIEFQHNTYGVTHINFVDSLMNGNLKEFKSFCQSIIDRNLNITWWGYARADGRMDLEFYKLMAAAGAKGFNIGIESGSDKVLKGINKKNTVAEVNQNLIDAAKVGILSNACLVLGAPEEDTEAFMHTLTLLWNHRTNIHGTSPGPGLGDNEGSAYDDRAKFQISERKDSWLSGAGWWKNDRSNTALHRMLRVKFCHMWIHVCREFGNGTLVNIHQQDNPISNHFNVSFIGEDKKICAWIEPEVFDCQIIKSDLGTFANTLMNEVFSFLRLLWRARGGFEIHIDCSDHINRQDFGFVFHNSGDGKFDSDIKFKIDDDGNYTADMKFSFVNNIQNIKPNHPFDEQNFTYHYINSGIWNEAPIKKTNKVFYLKNNANNNNVVPNNVQVIQAARKTTLPLYHAYAGISYDARLYLNNLAKTFKVNDIVLDINSNLGAIASILAHRNSYINILTTFKSFDAINYINGIKNYSDEQIIDEGTRYHNLTKEDCIKIISEIDDLVIKNPSGKDIFDKITSNFNNIKNIDISKRENISMCNAIILNAHTLPELEIFYSEIIFNYLRQDGKLIILNHYNSKILPDVISFGENLMKRNWTKISERNDVLVLSKNQNIK